MSRPHVRMAQAVIPVGVGTCPTTSKRQFVSRKAAKAVRRRVSPGLSPYHCLGCDYWHLGHLPERVVRGELDRDRLRRGAVDA